MSVLNLSYGAASKIIKIGDSYTAFLSLSLLSRFFCMKFLRNSGTYIFVISGFLNNTSRLLSQAT